MDVNDLRIAVTLSSFVLFLALMAYTWNRRRKAEYDEAAMLPFRGESAADSAPQARNEGDRA
jgi:cytochrome c oxidase cbb3-type subunit 4